MHVRHLVPLYHLKSAIATLCFVPYCVLKVSSTFTPKYRLDPSSYNIRATARTTARRYVAHLFSGAHLVHCQTIKAQLASLFLQLLREF